MDLYICTKREFYFSKKKKKKKIKRGYLRPHFTLPGPKHLLWWISPHFVIFVNFGRGTRKIIGIQRKPFSNLVFVGFLEEVMQNVTKGQHFIVLFD